MMDAVEEVLVKGLAAQNNRSESLKLKQLFYCVTALNSGFRIPSIFVADF